jgi:hypothetical protein
VLRQQRSSGGDLAARARHQARRAGVLVGLGRLSGKRFVLLPRKDRDFSTRRLLKANVHDIPSIIYFPPVLQRGSSRERFGVA